MREGKAGVLTTFPVSVLLGTDCPGLMELLSGKSQKSQKDALKATPAQAREIDWRWQRYWEGN